MKKTRLLFLSLLAIVFIGISSCQKDDDGPKNGKLGDIRGYWASTENPQEFRPTAKVKSKVDVVRINPNTKYTETYMAFLSKNICKSIFVQKDGSMKILDVHVSDAFYEYQLNDVIITYPDNETTHLRYTIKDDIMTMKFVDESGKEIITTYKSVKENVVKPLIEWTPEGVEMGDLTGGAWAQYTEDEFGEYKVTYYDVYQKNGTMREYLVWKEKGKFTSCEYKDYNWKIEGTTYYQKEKGVSDFGLGQTCEVNGDNFKLGGEKYAHRVKITSEMQGWFDGAGKAL